ncbi:MULTISPECIES: hypothetical protein [unclassified Halomonas]|uniref:hypothetical protein n=1 Tax=unclassified Halomonas TaxID=2609666 RepID=UPI001EF72C6F|nr:MULTISPECIES: hypothetical protein [unclassified Halomonas]MCG7576490.1 hypothetical protein [Halomonas sp. MMH1-48]MCG7603553.1 hypothetical protein [Halomonas sp. MM17-34]MCG7612975.1 hypothetical protein [Halomonas sp. MM17-29]MCG7619404.1 hypothetical protein [Halomonas sp. DSH1-27]
MEEVTREIALSLSMKTIFISIIAAGGTIAIAAVLKPAILIFRDLIAWKLIEKYYFNDKTREDIETLERLKKRLSTQFANDPEYIEDPEGITIISAKIDNKETSPHYAYIYDDTKKFIEEEINFLEESTNTKRIRLAFILQHLGMKEIKNPLENLSEKQLKIYQENTPREVKLDYNWAEEEALKEIKRHL